MSVAYVAVVAINIDSEIAAVIALIRAVVSNVQSDHSARRHPLDSGPAVATVDHYRKEGELVDRLVFVDQHCYNR